MQIIIGGWSESRGKPEGWYLSNTALPDAPAWQMVPLAPVFITPFDKTLEARLEATAAPNDTNRRTVIAYIDAVNNLCRVVSITSSLAQSAFLQARSASSAPDKIFLELDESTLRDLHFIVDEAEGRAIDLLKRGLEIDESWIPEVAT